MNMALCNSLQRECNWEGKLSWKSSARKYAFGGTKLAHVMTRKNIMEKLNIRSNSAVTIIFWWRVTPSFQLFCLLYPNIGLGFSTFYLTSRAAKQYGISVFCTDFTCKIREYEFGLQNTEIELCQFCHLKYCCQNKAYLFWIANQSGFVAFYALKPSNTSLITKTFNLLYSTCSSSMRSCLTSCSCSTGRIH